MKALIKDRRSILRVALAIIYALGAYGAILSSSVSAAPTAGHTGQALALRAALHPNVSQEALAKILEAQKALPSNTGRFALPRNFYQPKSRKRGPHDAPSSVVVNEGVQTYDVFAPPPSFVPADGPLRPMNLTPAWTGDERYIVFSSNRPHQDINGNQNVMDGTFHIWSISAKGDSQGVQTLHQITVSSGSEFFPTLNPVNNQLNSQLAFTSTVGSPNNSTENLYAISNFDASSTSVTVDSLRSLTIRPDLPNGTGFGEVDRPTWSPDGQRLAFSAVDTSGPYVGHFHIWYLFVISEGGLVAAAPSIDNPPLKLTDGPADDTDPAWDGTGGDVIAFSSTAPAIGNSTSSPAITSAPGSSPLRSLYVMTGGGTSATKITNTSSATTDDFGPAWNTNLNSRGLLAFSRGSQQSAPHDIYTMSAYAVSGSNITISPESLAQPASLLNTDDNAAGSTPANQYNDSYPSWSPFVTNYSITYASNRSVTYNDPVTGYAEETAISLPDNTNGLSATYTGILVSRYADLDPPTLLPYSAGEVIHVTDGSNTPTDPSLTPRRNGDIKPGAKVSFTVRVSNREAGNDDDNIYIQIKDPDSKYQDAQGLEHKVFTKDQTDFLKEATPESYPAFNLGGNLGKVSSSVAYLYNGGFVSRNNDPLNPEGFGNVGAYLNFGNAMQAFSIATNVTTNTELRGTVGGWDGSSAISVGHLDPANQGTNPVTDIPASGDPQTPLPGGDPANFTTVGQEYECQYVNAQFGINGDPANGAADTVPSDYGTPYYLAGIDDQGSGTGSAHAPRTEWLHLTKIAAQDGAGGVLYSATWTTPTSASDYYLDVIAYDKSLGTSVSAATTVQGTPTAGSNWRIYDNVWGFSTQVFNGNNDILVVDDNALGQKFVASTFGGQGFNNIPPIFYGAESYYTDIDVNLLPNTVYREVQLTGKTPMLNGVAIAPDTRPVAQLFPIGDTGEGSFAHIPAGGNNTASVPVLNGLGVGSYPDTEGPGTTSIDGIYVPKTQQYSLWRILARGGVSPGVLKAYEPTSTVQPPVDDPLTGFTGTTDANNPPVSVPNAPRCVLWIAPYAGFEPLNVTGSIADGVTQANLAAFVNAGGHLYVGGQSVASTLVQGGIDPNQNGPGHFLYDILNAKYVPNTGGNQNLSGAGLNVRVTGDGYFNPNIPSGNIQRFLTTAATDGWHYAAPNTQPMILGNNYINIQNDGSLWRTDGSMDQQGPQLGGFGAAGPTQSQISVITAQNGATTDTSFAGPGNDSQTNGTGPGLIYKEFSGPGGGRVVFSSFGLEGLGVEYYKYTVNNNDYYYPRNQRANVLHNLVCMLRTGTVTGNVFSGSTGGQGVGGATVYLLANGGTTIPGNPVRQTFSAMTLPDGSFRIDGVEPGAYIAVAYKTGWTRAVANNANDVEGDATISFNLNIIPVPPGSISGKVVDDKGNYVGGATITYISTDGVKVTGTSSTFDGTYTISGVGVGTYNGTASAPGYTDATVTDVKVTSGTTTPNENFTLTAVPGTLGGLVKDAFTNKTIPGATVTISQNGKTIDTFTTTAGTPTKAGPTGDGTAVNYIDTLKQGIYQVSVTAPDGYNAIAPATVSVTSNTFTRQDFALTGTLGGFGGLVYDATTTKPIVGATVTVLDAAHKVVATATTGDAATSSVGQDGDGQSSNFIIDLPAGTYTYTVTAPHYAPVPATGSLPLTVNTHTFTRIKDASGNNDVALKSVRGTLLGLVTDKDTGVPIGGATITVVNNNTKVQQTYTTAADGSTTTPPVSPDGDGKPINYTTVDNPIDAGNYTITVTAPNYAAYTNTFDLKSQVPNRQDAPLVSTQGTIGGLILDSATGLPIKGASVSLVDTSGNVVYSETTAANGDTSSPPVSRAGDGKPVNYVTGLLPAGDYNLVVSKQGGGGQDQPDYNPQTIPVIIKADQFTRKDLTLVYAYGSIGGLVTDSATGKLISAATVTVTDSNGNVVATLTSLPTSTSPSQPAGDGNPQNYKTITPLYQGVYSVTATADNHKAITVSPVTVVASQFKRLDFPLVTTIGTLGGLVTDSFSGQPLGNANVTITDSNNNIVATFVTSATTSSPAEPNGDGKAINYSGTLTEGVYTVAVSKRGYGALASQTITIIAGRFNRLDFDSGTTGGLPPVHVFPAGMNFFSTPYNYASIGVGFDQLLGTLNTGTRASPSPGSNRSHIYVWSPLLVQYVLDPQAPADGLHLGQGYWVYLTANRPVTVAGADPSAAAGAVSVVLQPGWNMIGVPSLTAVPVSGLTFLNPSTGGRLTFNQATTGSRLISPVLYSYNGTSYDSVTAASSLQPWQAYWVYAFTTTTVQIPTS